MKYNCSVIRYHRYMSRGLGSWINCRFGVEAVSGVHCIMARKPVRLECLIFFTILCVVSLVYFACYWGGHLKSRMSCMIQGCYPPWMVDWISPFNLDPQSDILRAILETEPGESFSCDGGRGELPLKYSLHEPNRKIAEYLPLLEPEDRVLWNSNMTLLIYVYSHANSTRNRNRIRQTWGNPAYYDPTPKGRFDVRVLFVVGMPHVSMDLSDLVSEYCAYRDILLFNFVDTYHNLTTKGLLAMSWIVKNLHAVNYVFKTDDDILLNVYNLINEIGVSDETSHPSPLPVALIRGCVMNGTPYRKGKWAVSTKEYPKKKYPPFCSGTGYLMSMTAMRCLVIASGRVPMFKLEDVYFTGMLAERCDVPRQIANGTYRLFNNWRNIKLDANVLLVMVDSRKMSAWPQTWLDRVQQQEYSGHPGDDEVAIIGEK